VQCKLLKPHIWQQNKRDNNDYDNVSVFCINLIEADKQMKLVFSRSMKQITLEQPSS